MAAPASPYRIPYVNFRAQYEAEREHLLGLVDAVFASGGFVGSPQVGQFEQALAARLGVAEAVALNSGTDALVLAMRSLGIGPGDEVVTPANSFIASTAAIVHLGAIPVFADVLPDLTIDPEDVARAITPRTKAIMPVHLTGRMADMVRLRAMAEHHGLLLVEDAAQAVGAGRDGLRAGAAGQVGCFSAHPLKNLNAAGDAGYVTTGDGALAARLRLLRNHGLKDRDTVVEFGVVSRMDGLQAAILTHRLAGLDEVIARRRAIAARYRAGLDPDKVFIAPEHDGEFHTYHTFVVQVDRRDELKAFLAARGIETAIHYPVPIHRQEAWRRAGLPTRPLPETERQAGRILSLPVHPFLTDSDVDEIVGVVHEFLD